MEQLYKQNVKYGIISLLCVFLVLAVFQFMPLLQNKHMNFLYKISNEAKTEIITSLPDGAELNERVINLKVPMKSLGVFAYIILFTRFLALLSLAIACYQLLLLLQEMEMNRIFTQANANKIFWVGHLIMLYFFIDLLLIKLIYGQAQLYLLGKTGKEEIDLTI